MSGSYRRWLILGAALLVAFPALVGGAYALIRAQTSRADSLLTGANGHIEQANALIAGLGLDKLDAGQFTSLENISTSASVAASAGPGLESARQETQAAADAARRARGLLLLPAWYGEYLSKKEEVAGLRLEQIDTLSQKIDDLNKLYASGDIIYKAIQDRDRLMGEFQAAYGMIKDDPTGAIRILGAVDQGLRQTMADLTAAYKQNGFSLLYDLSASTGRYIELTDLARSLASAAAAGDQAGIQDISASIENKLGELAQSTAIVDAWWQDRITPLERQNDELQTRQEQLDAEASAIYLRGRRPPATSTEGTFLD